MAVERAAPPEAYWAREAELSALKRDNPVFDIAIIGGGANGAGIAYEAGRRGLSCVLLERGSFASGTSSRSSKLIHGGIRYLAQGQFQLVRQALHERAYLCRCLPDLVQPLEFVVPTQGMFERAKFAAGVGLYALMARGAALGKGRLLSRSALKRRIPQLDPKSFDGGVSYVDAQFDDAQLVLALLEAARRVGVQTFNYCDVVDFEKTAAGRIVGLHGIDQETNEALHIRAKQVVNAAGPFVDTLRSRLDESHAPSLTTSQGAHVVISHRFANEQAAIVFPQTPDHRIMFAIPWQRHLVLGTTDTKTPGPEASPIPQREEVEMILKVAGNYLDPAPTKEDILSVFAGIRPLMKGDEGTATSKVSREHQFVRDPSGLISVVGGKWTTYRVIAKDCLAELDLPSHTSALAPDILGEVAADRAARREITGRDDSESQQSLHPQFSYRVIDCIDAIRGDGARHVDDILAYHLRALFLNSEAARACIPKVTEIAQAELRKDEAWAQLEIERANRAADTFAWSD